MTPDGPDPSPAPSPGVVLDRLCAALGDWGRLVLEVAPRGDAAALEQIIGGLVDWMGNELLDGWLHLPIPVFERVSQAAEEVFQASRSYLEGVRAEGVLPEPDRAAYESVIRAILERISLLKTGLPNAGCRGTHCHPCNGSRDAE
jgi:hypothetical protein